MLDDVTAHVLPKDAWRPREVGVKSGSSSEIPPRVGRLLAGMLAAALSACEGPVGPTTREAVHRQEPLVEFRALIIDGNAYPLHQFHAAPPDRCQAEHWHAHAPVRSIGSARIVTTFGALNILSCHDGAFPARPDPDPEGCGFGKVGEVPTGSYAVVVPCWDRFVQ
jgi:hypothetical protein